ncbi:hypothetical protein BLNAU_11065 [Blattamonas nauphoetae]|uniref:Uncharacterized protein n=1 Tax=Blattamonas nauphoetae TaxID=2049346 RepID=A0ABQ9XNJ7_9EUKA|nr:hypothetical protein BLNAU_11065 [Blattamonas nauphoetae]
MVQEEYPFDEIQENRAVTLLSCLRSTSTKLRKADSLVTGLLPSPKGPCYGFLHSLSVLILSYRAPLVEATLEVLRFLFNRSNPSMCLSIVKMNFFTELWNQIPSSMLYSSSNSQLCRCLVEILENAVSLSTRDMFTDLAADTVSSRQLLRQQVFFHVIQPSEIPLSRLLHNHHFFTRDSNLRSFLRLITNLLEISCYHQRTLDYVSSSPVPHILTKTHFELEEGKFVQRTLYEMDINEREVERDGDEALERRTEMTVALNSEGWEDEMELQLFAIWVGQLLREILVYTFRLNNGAGMNGNYFNHRTRRLNKELPPYSNVGVH